MLCTIGEREFHQLVLEKEDVIHARGGFAAPAIIALTVRWMAELEAPATSILVYLIGRTVSTGKAADRISVKEFITAGPNDPSVLRFAPLPMSINTLRKHIKSLCDDDLITIYSARSALEGIENQPRMFEINFRKLLDIPILEVGREQFFDHIEQQITAEKEGRSYQKLLLAPS